MPHSDLWQACRTATLRYWRERATLLYLKDCTTTDRNKDGSRSAGNRAAIDNGIILLRCIARELNRRGTA